MAAQKQSSIFNNRDKSCPDVEQSSSQEGIGVSLNKSTDSIPSDLTNFGNDFYKITKADSQSSIEQSVTNLDPNLASNLMPTTNNRCANRRAEEMSSPKNTPMLDSNCKVDQGEASKSPQQEDSNVRMSGKICKKRMNKIENVAHLNGRGGIGAIGWQATLPSTRERLSYMLMNETLADIYFIFRGSDGTVQKIPAHKFVLSVGSAVFEAMFRFSDSSPDGGCSNCIRELELVDVEREAFEALLTFLYIDDIQSINKETVMSILYTAKKYAVPTLESACVNFLETCLNGDNAFMLLSKARFYDEQRLANQCLEIIDEETQEAMKSEDFLSIDHETLCAVLGRDTLRVKELSLFKATVRWAFEKCRAKCLQPTPENLRLALGVALNQLRFPLMSPSDFAKYVAPTKLLTDAEMVGVFLYYHLGPEHPVPFRSNYRGLYTPELVVKRFQRIESSWGYTGTPDRVKFMVDTPVFILGFGLYGSNRDSCQYAVLIEILNFNTGKLLASNECRFLSDGSPSTFRVLFDEPVEICSNTTYVASAKLTGHESHYGTKGLRKIKLERNGRPDINWHFQYAPGNNNGTSVEDGQIPEILFCAKHPY
ncbi:BTB/POZ domain-containing protein 1 [Globodera pallida]|nr:BTB/POZ domain-containing protein 1 [Globodera pallida]